MKESLTVHEHNYRKIIKEADADKYESIFKLQIFAYALPSMERNYQFDVPDSRMELDFAHPSTKVGVEIQGGILNKKRMGHSTGSGITRDIRKMNAAQMKGWVVILLTPQMVEDGSGALLVKRVIDKKSQ